MQSKPFLCCLKAKPADNFLISAIINWKICHNLGDRTFPSEIFISEYIKGTGIAAQLAPRASGCLFFEGGRAFGGLAVLLFSLSTVLYLFHKGQVWIAQ
jgi:hypothetical protein